ncbi:hypothetical protein V5799_014024 [Amblyomma americanum]|uniref:Uncharacterized protein n=1 Tax=Amblyomma americanum TaxID=6943 RepID=A0AAQ4E488_AMBAM
MAQKALTLPLERQGAHNFSRPPETGPCNPEWYSEPLPKVWIHLSVLGDVYYEWRNRRCSLHMHGSVT